MDLITEYQELKNLLTSWNLSELFDYFKDEGINLEELEFIKPHHIYELLHNYKMGIRIRFEHKLEMWRRDLNKPLLNTPSKYVYGSTTITSKPAAHLTGESKLSNYHHYNQSLQQHQVLKMNRSTNTRIMKMVNASTYCNIMPPRLQPMSTSHINLLYPEMPTLIPQPKLLKLERSPTPISSPTLPTTAKSILTDEPVTKNQSNELESINVDTNFDKKSIDTNSSYYEYKDNSLIQILRESGERGDEIVAYYEKHNQLSANVRTLLVHLIVKYFEKNNYHLSLNMSHILEKEIINFFPNEKLENYRTEKRGKIYVKFCNMKRYRRDRLTTRRKYPNDLSKSKKIVERCFANNSRSNRNKNRERGNSNEVNIENDQGPVDDEDDDIIFNDDEHDVDKYVVDDDEDDYSSMWTDPDMSMVDIKTEHDDDEVENV